MQRSAHASVTSVQLRHHTYCFSLSAPGRHCPHVNHTVRYATQLWASHAKLCVRLRAMSWDPKLGTLHYETTICTWESNWVYVQSAAVHPCSSSLSPLLLLAVCVCRNPRLLLSVACHLLALLHQAVRGRSCLGSRLGAGGRRVRCLGVLVVDFASFSAC